LEERINVPIDDPNADTEWNEILRKHNIIPEKTPDPTPQIEATILKARELAHENRLEGKDLDELDEFEDHEEDAFLEEYRQRRIQEFQSLTKKSLHGTVYPISKPEYSREVTEASNQSPVLVHLTSSLGTNVESRILTELWRRVAAEYGEIKFCEIRGNMAIEGYPDKNCPTILVYHKGDIVKQVVTLINMGGAKCGFKEIDALLVEVGAVKPNDVRVGKRIRAEEDKEAGAQRSGIRSSATKASVEDDDDWD